MKILNIGFVFTILAMIATVPASSGARGESTGSSLKLDASSRVGVALTIYQQDVALITDLRETVLPDGRVNLEFQDVASTLEPTSVRVRELNQPRHFSISEQRFHYDLLNRETLLQRFIGRKVKYSRSVLEGTSFEKVLRLGTLLSVNPEIVQFGDQIEIEPEGTISLAYIPEDLRTTPALSWQINNGKTGSKRIETRYLAGGIFWSLDYNLVLDADGKRFDLDAWVTLHNRSGLSFGDAVVNLMAGDLNREQVGYQADQFSMARAESVRRAVAAQPGSEPKGLGGYYLYPLPGRYTLADGVGSQVSFLQQTGLKAARTYRLVSQVTPNENYNIPDQAFDMELVFVNDRKSGPDVPLPAGLVRVYQLDDNAQASLVGEDRITHVPRGEEVRLSIGKAFDLVAERRLTQFRRMDNRRVQLAYEVTVRNRESQKRSVEIDERFYGSWKILSENQSGTSPEANVRRYRLDIPKGGEVKLAYTAELNF